MVLFAVFVSFRQGFGAAMLIVHCWLVVSAVPPLESVTVAVKVNVPAMVGVPVMVPSGLSVNPGGNEPEIMTKV